MRVVLRQISRSSKFAGAAANVQAMSARPGGIWFRVNIHLHMDSVIEWTLSVRLIHQDLGVH
ncbi:hypothetical protein PI124_g839 [Phytophthora idaei]|nr:hypothetical protein PI125_g743 [Phytophthora idaei]KAG3254625.1 hypothetical protein PI124_g839 [Phytophthora idaei]